MDSVGRAALEGAALGALAGGVGAAVGAAGLSGAAAFAVSEGADFIGGFLYDIGVNGLSREEALINGLMGIGFGGAIGLLGRGISRAARNVNLPLPRQLRRQCASFSAETMVATPDGDKPISEIEVGDVILAYSEATEEVDIYHVSATHTQHHETTLDVTIDGETLHTTDEHPFYVIRDNEEQWVQAQHLHIGDAILSALGETGIVEDIIIIDQPQTMYNLTVSLVATYLVGNGQWVVHNQNPNLEDLWKPITAMVWEEERLISTTDWRANLMAVWDLPAKIPTVAWQAHHLVPQTPSGGLGSLAEPGQEVLAEYGIHIHSPANLVWLPRDRDELEALESLVNNLPLPHLDSGLHNYRNVPPGQSDLPINNVVDRLTDLQEQNASRVKILNALYDMANACLTGDFP